MGIITKGIVNFAKGYVSERGIEGTIQDIGQLANGAKKLGSKFIGKDREEDYDEEEYDYSDEGAYSESNDGAAEFFNEATWKKLCDILWSDIERGNYDEALSTLGDYYGRYEVEREYWYQNWKATILIYKYKDCWDRPVEKDLALKSTISNVILSCSRRYDEDKDSTKELKDRFENAKNSVAEIRMWLSVWDNINELRDPENIVGDSKTQDCEDAFAALDEFIHDHPDFLDDATYSLLKARIYNAFFCALAKYTQELQALSDSELESYFDDAEACVDMFQFDEDEDTSDEEFLSERIPEQIEELKQLRSGKNAFSQTSPSGTTDNEQEYLEELKASLADDGKISDRERHLLDRLRKSLGISEQRAAVLEASLSSLSEEEKEYQEELRACMDDGQISDRERRLLERLRKSLGISDARAKELEQSLA